MTLYHQPNATSSVGQLPVKYAVLSYSMNCVAMTFSVTEKRLFADGNLKISDEVLAPTQPDRFDIPEVGSLAKIAAINCAPYRHMR